MGAWSSVSCLQSRGELEVARDDSHPCQSYGAGMALVLMQSEVFILPCKVHQKHTRIYCFYIEKKSGFYVSL